MIELDAIAQFSIDGITNEQNVCATRSHYKIDQYRMFSVGFLSNGSRRENLRSDSRVSLCDRI
ncbi:MAG: hypothetical protein F6J86_20475 [Symploca sp. SIO1B1]|nr:hypothetical protein [Symploca sp. SIO2D2]NER96187.1 hypothetical protein [Symploca sp. SIO1B1]